LPLGLEKIRKLGKTKEWEEKEKKVRNILGKRLKTTFKRKKLHIGLKSDGTPKEHEFDLVSLNGEVVGEVKTFTPIKGGGRPSAKIDTTFLACFVLEKAKARRRLLVLTDEEFFRIFKKESNGIISKKIEILHIPV